MLRYYLAVGLRGLGRNKLYAAISIGGLGVSFAAALLIALYVRDELSYDRWLPNHERIYQVWVRQAPRGNLPSDVGQWLALDFPQLEAVTRLFPDNVFLQRGDRKFTEALDWVDPNFFAVFRLPAVAGDVERALARPDGLVLTRTLAFKYFGRADPIGETLLLDGEHPMTVTAVIEDLPSNTHLDIRALASDKEGFSRAAEQDRRPARRFGGKLWGSSTYFLLRKGASVDAVRSGLAAMQDRHLPSPPKRKVSEQYPMHVRPIADVHLAAGTRDGEVDSGRLYSVGAIGALIVLAAAINFINLMTALGQRRAREIGIRQSAGARRRDLVCQFLSETVLYVAGAAVVGVAIGAALVGPLNAFLSRDMHLAALCEPAILAASLGFLALIAVAAGAYPSIVLSSFQPTHVLKPGANKGAMARVRQSLVVLQFSILTALLICTTVADRQLRFGLAETLGRESAPVVVVKTKCTDAFKARVAALPGVGRTACAAYLPQQGGSDLISPMVTSERKGVGVHYDSLDFGFFDLYGIRVVAGRSFSSDLGTDEDPQDNVWRKPEAVIINETAVKRLGFPSARDAVGQIVKFNHLFALPSTFTGMHDAEIIGVVEDFQMGTVRSAIPPAAFFIHPGLSGLLSVKLSSPAVLATLKAIDGVWDELGEPGPIDRSFFDRSIQAQYIDLQRETELFSIFSAVAVLISMLGLVGLAADAAARRGKEIGIRKVLGAKRSEVVRLLLWQFSKPVLWANAVAWPAAYFAMRLWLQGFGRRIDLEPWMFAASGGAALAVALATVFLHSCAMASIRPARALRHE